LTVRLPSAWQLLFDGKDVENRSWATAYRGRLWIHAGKHVPPEVKGHPMALFAGYVIGSVTLVDCVKDSASPWALSESWHWVLADPRPLPNPVPVRGKLKIFPLPAGVADAITTTNPGHDG
jgi:hypothetical protein